MRLAALCGASEKCSQSTFFLLQQVVVLGVARISTQGRRVMGMCS